MMAKEDKVGERMKRNGTIRGNEVKMKAWMRKWDLRCVKRWPADVRRKREESAFIVGKHVGHNHMHSMISGGKGASNMVVL